MQSKITICTNNVPRSLILGYELTEQERREFDYISAEEIDTHEFFRYKGNVYDPSDFMVVRDIVDNYQFSDFAGWDGYCSDSYFSGLLIRYVDNYEKVIVAQYFS